MTQVSSLVSLVRNALAMSADCDGALSIPTLVIERPKHFPSWKGGPAADWALAYFSLNGFEGDRVRMNFYGYPGLLRNLNSPPPWIEVEPEDCDGIVSPERQADLQSLIDQAHSRGYESLLREHDFWLEHRKYEREVRRAFLSEELVIAELTDSPVEQSIMEIHQESFKTLLNLATALTQTQFEEILDAVFYFDEFSVTVGLPDLLVWLPGAEPPCWFFSEVKAPGDYMSPTQKDWLRNHWELVRGHYLLTMLE